MRKSFFILFFISELLLCPDAGATTRYVPSQYSTIQSAINACTNSDTVIVSDGTYMGFGNRDIDFMGKAITVRSQNGPENCIIDCQGSSTEPHRGFEFRSGEGMDSVLDGFTIINGYGPKEPVQIGDVGMIPVSVGGGIFCSHSGPKIINCTFIANSAGKHGGGAYNYQCWPAATFVNCVFQGNSAYDFGGGICNNGIAGGCYNTLIECMFMANSAYHGGGVFNGDSVVTLLKCTFTSNSAVGDGGGMYCFRYTSATFANCKFNANSAQEGGAIYNTSSSLMTMGNCVFVGNSASTGGALYNWGSCRVNLNNNTFTGNSAGYGTAIACDWYTASIHSDIQLDNCIFWDGGKEISNHNASTISITYSDVQGGWPGEGNIEKDPLFVSGPLGDFYLSQIASGQALQSPCVDAGSDDAVALGLHEYTTRTDGVHDVSTVDMGYHYDHGITLYVLTVSVIEDPNDPGAHGYVQPSGGLYYEGSAVELNAFPDFGYKLKKWTGTDDDTSSSQRNTVTMTDNKFVSVMFEPETGVTIRGTVYDIVTNVPIEGATINADGKGDHTDSLGKYEITGLSAGELTVGASKAGYKPKTQELHSTQPGQTYNIDFYLTPEVDIEILLPHDNDEFLSGGSMRIEVKLLGSAEISTIEFLGEIDPVASPPPLTFERFTDDGKSGDRMAGDGIYTTEIGLPNLTFGSHTLQVTALVTIAGESLTFTDSVPFVVAGKPVGSPRVTLDIEPRDDVLIYKSDRVVISAEVIYDEAGVFPDSVYAVIYNASRREIDRIILPLIDDVYTREYSFANPGPHTVDVTAEPPAGSSYLQGSASQTIYVHIDKLKVSLSVSPDNPSGQYLLNEPMAFTAYVSTEEGSEMPAPATLSVIGIMTNLSDGTSRPLYFSRSSAGSSPYTRYCTYDPWTTGEYLVTVYATASNYSKKVGQGIFFKAVEGPPALLSNALKRIYDDNWLWDYILLPMRNETDDLARDGDFLDAAVPKEQLELQWDLISGLAGAAVSSGKVLKGINLIDNPIAKWAIDFLNKAVSQSPKEAFIEWRTQDVENNTLSSLFDSHFYYEFGRVESEISQELYDLDLHLFPMPSETEEFYINDLKARGEYADFLRQKTGYNGGIVHHVREELESEDIRLDWVVNGVIIGISVINPPAGIALGLLKTGVEYGINYEQLQKTTQGSAHAWLAAADTYASLMRIQQNYTKFVSRVTDYEQNPVPKGKIKLVDNSPNKIHGVQEFMEGKEHDASYTYLIKKAWTKLEIENVGSCSADFAVNALFEDAAGIFRVASQMKDTSTGEFVQTIPLGPGDVHTVNIYFADLTDSIDPFFFYPGYLLFANIRYEPQSWRIYHETGQKIWYNLLAYTDTGAYRTDVMWDYYDPVGEIVEYPTYYDKPLTTPKTMVFGLNSLAQEINEPNQVQLGIYPIWKKATNLSGSLLCKNVISVTNPWPLPLATTVTQPINTTMTIESVSEPGALQNGEIIWNVGLYPHETKVLTYDFTVLADSIPPSGHITIPPAQMTIFDAVNDVEETFQTGNTEIVVPPLLCQQAIKFLGYDLVGKERKSRTEFEYMFRLRAENSWVDDIRDVTVKLIEEPNNTTVLDDTVTFSFIAAGTKALSDDTFKILSDRTIEGSRYDVVWEVSDCEMEARSDFDANWRVDFVDFARFAEAWLTTGDDIPQDLYPDGTVNLRDLLIFSEEWQK